MTPEAQRIAIAEECGYGDYGTRMRGWDDLDIAQLPDYLNDLNAMHEAEKTLTTEQKHDYVRRLIDILGGWSAISEFSTTFAASGDRAEAFLRTIGKWKDDIKV